MIPSLDVLSTTCLNYLLDAILVSAVLVPGILFIQWLTRDWLSPAAKHALWLILLLRLSLPGLPESPLGVIDPPSVIPQPLPPASAQSFPELEGSSPAPMPESSDKVQEKNPLESRTPTSANNEAPNPVPIQAPSSRSIEKPESPHPQPSAAPLPSDELISVAPRPSFYSGIRFSWQGLGALIWVSGFVAIVVRILHRHFTFRDLLHQASPIPCTSLFKQLQAIGKSLHIKQAPKLYSCKAVQSPALYGLFRSVILLPDRFIEDYSKQDQAHVLLHEMAHLKRRDAVWNLWATLIQAIHWPNPFIWFAVQRIRGDRELAADDLVLRKSRSRDPKLYGETILRTLQSLPQKTLAPGAIGIAEDRMSLRRRFNQIARFERQRRHSSAAALTLMALLGATCLTQVPFPEPEKHILEVYVTDVETNTPLPNVEVIAVFEYVMDYKSRETKEALTNEEGIALLEIPNKPGPETRFFLNALPPGNYVSQYRHWRDDEGLWGKLPNRHTFQLKKGTQIGGFVTDESGNPLENVAVHITAHAQSLTAKYRVDNLARVYRPYENGIRTDRNGFWASDGVPQSAGYFFVRFKTPGGSEHFFATPTFSLGHWSNHNGIPISGAELRNQTARVSLPQGNDITLTLIDTHEKPILGASVQEFTGAIYRRLGHKQSSDAKGQVQFQARNGHQYGYVAQHPRYATTTTLISLIDGERSARVVMYPRKTLTGQILDPKGYPIPRAKIDLGTEANTDSLIDWVDHSDDKGRFKWDHAPINKTFYRIRADGFATRVIELAPSSHPHSIRLQKTDDPVVTHQTLVINAANNQAIPSFAYTRRPSREFSNHSFQPGSKGLILDQMLSSNLVEEERSSGYEVYYISVQTPGFTTGQSRAISLHEYESNNVIRLHPAPVEGALENLQILGSDGNPAADTTVFLIDQSPLSLPSIHFLSASLTGKTSWGGIYKNMVRTDTKGRLPRSAFPDGFRGITILNDHGSLTVPAAELTTANTSLRITPFGEIRGTLLVDGTKRAGLRVGLRAKPDHKFMITGTLYTYTDDNGDFQFDRVPEGRYRLFRSNNNINYLAGHEYYPQPISVKSGETKTVDYRIEGHSLSGTFVSDLPSRNIPWQAGTYWLEEASSPAVSESAPHHDTFIQSSRLARESLRYRNEVTEPAKHSSVVYPLVIDADGHFSASSIPPGAYSLEIHVQESEQQGGTIKKILVTQHRVAVTIPTHPKDLPIDLGRIVLPTLPLEE